jgi:(R,R)-butanediol dehydrogenase / meso-butanediol dehydrogenase / diacetyl reductase
VKCARWYGTKVVRVEEAPLPLAKDDEAVVRVLWTGLCGSDLEEYLHGPVVAHPPVVLGHEIVGVVEVSARDGSGPREGTHVVVDVVTGCGRCYWCQRHEEGLCPELTVTGQHIDGGLAEYVVGRANRLVVVPDGVDVRHAALAEPAAVAVRAVRRLGSVLGRSAVVVGGGTVGILVAQLLAHSGASHVILLEPARWRREVARALALRAEWAPSVASRRTLAARLLPERGADLVIECAGVADAVRESIHLARPGGTIVLLGVPIDDAVVDVRDIVLSEKQVRGSAAHMWDDDVQTAVGYLASGVLQVAPLITHEVCLDEAPLAFEQLAEGSQPVFKLLVKCASDTEPQGSAAA